MNKALETKIRALIAKERIITDKALHRDWQAVDWVIFYACAPFAQYGAFAEFLKDAKLRQAMYPHLFKGLKDSQLIAQPITVKSEAQGVHDFVSDAERALGNEAVFDSLVEQIGRWLDAYSMLLDTMSLFKSRGLGSPEFTEAFSHIDPSVRSNELGNDTVITDVNVLGKIFLQNDPDRMATLLNTSFRGTDSQLKSFFSVGIPPAEAVNISQLTDGILSAYGKLLGGMAEHINFLKTLPFKRPASPAKQADTANNRKKGDGKAGLNNNRHGKAAEGDKPQKQQRRSHGAGRGKPAQSTRS